MMVLCLWSWFWLVTFVIDSEDDCSGSQSSTTVFLKTTLTRTITKDKQFNEDSSLDSEDDYHSGS